MWRLQHVAGSPFRSPQQLGSGCLPGTPVAWNLGLLCLNKGLPWGIVRLLGFPSPLQQAQCEPLSRLQVQENTSTPISDLRFQNCRDCWLSSSVPLRQLVCRSCNPLCVKRQNQKLEPECTAVLVLRSVAPPKECSPRCSEAEGNRRPRLKLSGVAASHSLEELLHTPDRIIKAPETLRAAPGDLLNVSDIYIYSYKLQKCGTKTFSIILRPLPYQSQLSGAMIAMAVVREPRAEGRKSKRSSWATTVPTEAGSSCWSWGGPFKEAIHHILLCSQYGIPGKSKRGGHILPKVAHDSQRVVHNYIPLAFQIVLVGHANSWRVLKKRRATRSAPRSMITTNARGNQAACKNNPSTIHNMSKWNALCTSRLPVSQSCYGTGTA